MHINLALEQAVFSVYKNFSWFIKNFLVPIKLLKSLELISKACMVQLPPQQAQV